MGTISCTLGRDNIRTVGLKADINCDILSLIGTFRGTGNIPIPCIVTPHHRNSITAYCSGPRGTTELLN